MAIKEPIISNCNNSEFNPAYSFELKKNPTQGEVDTFDHILQVTSHHEAVYAYYYMDDNNKVSTMVQYTFNKFYSFKSFFLFEKLINFRF